VAAPQQPPLAVREDAGGAAAVVATPLPREPPRLPQPLPAEGGFTTPVKSRGGSADSGDSGGGPAAEHSDAEAGDGAERQRRPAASSSGADLEKALALLETVGADGGGPPAPPPAAVSHPPPHDHDDDNPFGAEAPLEEHNPFGGGGPSAVPATPMPRPAMAPRPSAPPPPAQQPQPRAAPQPARPAAPPRARPDVPLQEFAVAPLTLGHAQRGALLNIAGGVLGSLVKKRAHAPGEAAAAPVGILAADPHPGRLYLLVMGARSLPHAAFKNSAIRSGVTFKAWPAFEAAWAPGGPPCPDERATAPTTVVEVGPRRSLCAAAHGLFPFRVTGPMVNAKVRLELNTAGVLLAGGRVGSAWVDASRAAESPGQPFAMWVPLRALAGTPGVEAEDAGGWGAALLPQPRPVRSSVMWANAAAATAAVDDGKSGVLAHDAEQHPAMRPVPQEVAAAEAEGMGEELVPISAVLPPADPAVASVLLQLCFCLRAEDKPRFALQVQPAEEGAGGGGGGGGPAFTPSRPPQQQQQQQQPLACAPWQTGWGPASPCVRAWPPDQRG
jgi:hypothetical protein